MEPMQNPLPDCKEGEWWTAMDGGFMWTETLSPAAVDSLVARVHLRQWTFMLALLHAGKWFGLWIFVPRGRWLNRNNETLGAGGSQPHGQIHADERSGGS